MYFASRRSTVRSRPSPQSSVSFGAVVYSDDVLAARSEVLTSPGSPGFADAPTAGRATSVPSVTKKVARTSKTTMKKKVAAPSSSVALTTIVSTAALASTTVVPLVLDYDKVLNSAAPVEADLGPGYQYLSDPTLSSNDARYRSAMSRVAACNGFRR